MFVMGDLRLGLDESYRVLLRLEGKESFLSKEMKVVEGRPECLYRPVK